MDPQGSYNIGENAVPYSFAEIWPFTGGCAASSRGGGNVADSLAAGISRSMNMNMNMSLDVNLDRDPMVLERPSDFISNGVRRKREETTRVSTSREDNMMNEYNYKRIKTAEELNENDELKAEDEAKEVKSMDQNAKTAEPSKQDYIHVRARRGQATDSHSLAERARREKISERMKILQDLVPGCNKVIGKALVLDEIINYVQSLQGQVEFLSMKLEAVNSRLPGVEGFPLKDYVQPPFDASGMPFGPQSSRNYERSSSPEWLHMQIGGGFDRTT